MDSSATFSRTRRSALFTLPAAAFIAVGLLLSPLSLRAQGSSGRSERPDENPAARSQLRLLQITGKKGAQYDPNMLVKAKKQMKAMQISPAAWPPKTAQAASGTVQPLSAGIAPAQWQELGPGNVGGRIRSILPHPTNPDILYIGSVSGGIWKTVNRGQSWIPLNDFMANIAIGCMAMDRTNANTIYAGTGEIFAGDGIRGAGLFKTTDGGVTWNQLASTAGPDWHFVNRLAISPVNNQILLAATNKGIFRSTDGGSTWSLRLVDDFVFDLDFHPSDGSRAIAGGSNKGWFSLDGGLSWTLAVATGGSAFGRWELAYAKSSPTTVYASIDNNGGELWRSTDGGRTYALRNTGNSLLCCQGGYDNALWVDPTNPNNLMMGGVNMWRSTNGGTTFDFASALHSDQHVVVEAAGFPNPRSVYVGNDGGIWRADDFLADAGYVNLNNSLGITKFYAGASNPNNGLYMGGTQDNGTPRYNGSLNGWADVICCDGGWTSADPALNPDGSSIWFGETQEWSHYRLKLDAGGNLVQSDFLAGIPSDPSLFIPPAILDPNGATRLYKGGLSLWKLDNPRTSDPSAPWVKVKGFNNLVSAIAVAPGNSNVIWVGESGGTVSSTTNGLAGSSTWTQRNASGTTLPNSRYVTRVTIDPGNSNRVYVTLGGFFPNNVWKTEDGGVNWTDISGNLPDVPVRTLAVNPGNSNFIYAGTEVGVFASENRGATWSPSTDGPNHCSVDELFWSGSYLVAATHGRGMHRILVNTPPTVTLNAPANNSTFPAGSTINLAATASDVGGSVTKVEFFAGSTKLGEDLTSPYNFAWVNVTAGSYPLTAKATDNNNGTATSAAVNISVTSGPVTLRNPLADAHVRDGASAGNNYGTAITLETKTGPAGFNRDCYLKFNVGSLSGTVSSAKLRLFGKLTDAGTVTVVAYAVPSTTWIESGAGSITWNNKPALGATQVSVPVTGITAAWHEFDLTNYIKSEIAAGRTTVTLALRFSATANPLFQANSREQAANKPELSLSLAAQPTALFVVGNPTLVAGDVAIRNRLQTMGFAVTVKDDDLAVPGDATGKSVVFISSSVISTTVNTKFRTTTTPVVNCEEKIQDDLGMTGLVSGTDYGTTASQTQVVMQATTHALAAGLTGTQTLTTATNAVNWGKPSANAARISTQIGDPSHFTEYGYAAGAAMPGLTAPGRRVNLSFTDATASSLTASGWALFEAAVRWAAGL